MVTPVGPLGPRRGPSPEQGGPGQGSGQNDATGEQGSSQLARLSKPGATFAETHDAAVAPAQTSAAAANSGVAAATAGPALSPTAQASRALSGGEPATSADGPEPEPLANQLASGLAPVMRQADGAYQVNIRLQPEELGVVHVALHLEAGTVNVSLHAEGDATRNMLRQNLGQLREQMASSGLSTGRFDVAGGSSGGDSSPYGSRPTAQLEEADPEGPALSQPALQPDAATLSPLVNGQLDVRM
ncbi:MAG TPA: flagellar hook-length control protein FliK [Acidimicrobiales bacterium]|nr:flagellar hook-length control protein FliK [Acidimicrobiales bacterium]